MKIAHPIRINKGRERLVPGGDWTHLDSFSKGRVQILQVPDRNAQAKALAAQLEKLKKCNPALLWSDCAVLARTHEELAIIRAALEYVEIPVTYTRQDLSLPIGRVREVFQFFATLEPLRNDLKRASELEALLNDAAGVKLVSRNPWWNLLSICLQAWLEETGNSELPVKQAIDYLWEALAEQKRDRHMGRGVFLSSVHYAKGTEFDHVFVADGGWNEKKGAEEEERRVYYVAMTRAKQTLTLFQRGDERNPYCDILKSKVSGEQLVTFTPGEKNIPDAVLQRRYDVISLKDVFLDYAGRMTASSPVHQLLEQTKVGDLVQFKNAGERLEVCNPVGQPIAVLSKTAKETWTDAQGQIESIKVLAMVERRTDDSKNPDYKNLLQVESWEVPVLEVVWSSVP